MTTLGSSVRRSVGLAAAIALIGTLLVTAAADAKAPGQCDVRNTALHDRYATLQSAVDAARSGDTLRVKGTCVGPTTIPISLTIDGQPKATLDAGGAGWVVTIGDRGVDPAVTMSGLVITHGGGGVILRGGSLTLVGSTVTENAAGIYVWDNGNGPLTLQDSVVTQNTGTGILGNHGGPVVLNGASSVDHNAASGLEGGGLWIVESASATLNDTSSVHDNTAPDGGGIYVAGLSEVVLNDSVSVYGNSADRGGGAFVGLGSGLVLNGAASVHDNTATTSGGGVSRDAHGYCGNCVAGGNVFDNVPDDIFVEP